MQIIIPPFADAGEDNAEFYCLAFAPVKYHQTRKPRIPASLGIYFCMHKSFTRFSRISFGADGQSLSYTRGNDQRDTLDFLFLSALLRDSVHPAAWRLFPRAQIPANFHSNDYENARKDLCRLIYHFRAHEMAERLTANMPHEPLMIFDEAFGRLALGDSKEEGEEISEAVMEAERRR